MGNKKLEPKMIEMQIKPGEVRNPKGRPEGSKNSKTILKELLSFVPDKEKINPATGEPFTNHEMLMLHWFRCGSGYQGPDKKYRAPNWKAIESLVNRVDGKVDQTFKVGDDPENPISGAITSAIAKQLKQFVDEETKESER